MAPRIQSPPVPLRKRLLFSAILAVSFLAALEALAWLTGNLVLGRTFSQGQIQERRGALIDSGGRVALRPNVRWVQDEPVHPYLGFTPALAGDRRRFSLAGATPASVPRRTPDRIVVALVGGSFARLFGEQGVPHLVARMGELPAFRGKTIDVVNLAAGGYKQPQQLMSLAYMLALGAEFDVVINLDGFNDIALHPTENAAAGVFPAYPRRWHQRVDGLLQGGPLRLMLRRIQIEEWRATLARASARLPWRHLYTANLAYALLDGHLARQVTSTDHQLLGEEHSSASIPFVATGATLVFGSDAEMFAYLADLWQRCSRLMQGLATANGARYYHFLQPNQYVPGSKPMGSQERADAWVASNSYRRIVEMAYPKLQEVGRSLVATGVRFTDLTGAFATHAEAIYTDSCCHVNARGNAIVADLLLDAIRRDVEPPPAPPRRPP